MREPSKIRYLEVVGQQLSYDAVPGESRIFVPFVVRVNSWIYDFFSQVERERVVQTVLATKGALHSELEVVAPLF